MIVAGVGCRRGTSADEIERVVRLALGMFELPAERLRSDRHRIGKGDRAGLPGGGAATVRPLDGLHGEPISIASPARS